MSDEKDLNVDTAYALETPDDNRALYAQWAQTYDRSFAEALDFLMPRHVARIFREEGGIGPVLDVGAGTGLVAAALQEKGITEVDGLDISPEMLQVATAKGLYRNTFVADLTRKLPLQDALYSGITSSGTFTHGHVGPEALDELLRISMPAALFVLTIKTEHFFERGFVEKFESLGEQITDFSKESLPIYGAGADSGRAQDEGLVVRFRRA